VLANRERHGQADTATMRNWQALILGHFFEFTL
jgi:hypothetical protein